MSTAHRPTWNPAAGASSKGGWASGGQISAQFSARDLPGHTKLKFRQDGQGTKEEIQSRDLKAELEDNEKKADEEKSKEGQIFADKFRKLRENRMLLLKGDSGADSREAALANVASKFDDADDVNSESESSDDSDSDDDDEEAELMLELEKIKKEREEERLRKEEEERKELESQKKAEILEGNPLASSSSGSAAIKRRWNEDVVFRNQSRNEQETKKRFINDTIRNDFHRRFLSQYIQ